MRSLYLRIWLTVVAALALFALVSGWMWQRHFEQERGRVEAAAGERLAAWAELVQRSLPAADAPLAEQAEALADWSHRLRVPMALDSARGQRIAASDSYKRREADGVLQATSVRLDDGRTLWLARRLYRFTGPDGMPQRGPPGWRDETASGPRSPGPHAPRLAPGDEPPHAAAPMRLPAEIGPMMMRAPNRPLSSLPFGLPGAVGPLILVVMLFIAVAAGAYPVVRRLTRRLEALKQGVEAFGAGDLGQRVDASGRDEVAAVAATFNRAAERVQTLLRSHQSLLANASHELRSPLARLKMAVTMAAELPPAQRAPLQREIDANIAELDALVEEVLLASRLDAQSPLEPHERVDLLVIAAEEAARIDAEVGALDEAARLVVPGSERLLRRAVRNLLENARRYGGGQVQVELQRAPGAAPDAAGQVQLSVCDRGAGVPADQRERIFEPFFRLPGHAEREGGVGLGLSLVRQIAQRHGGSVRCEARAGGGSCFVLSLPAG